MHTHKQATRITALLLSLLLVFGFLSVPAAFAEDLPEPTPLSTPAGEGLATPETGQPATPTPAPTEQPTPTPPEQPTPTPAALPPAPEGGLVVVEEIATPETGMLFGMPRGTYAALSEEIPVIHSDILGDSTKKVVLINEDTNTQTGYATLQDAMNAIGAETTKYNYTIVFVQDYTMTYNKEHPAIRDKSAKAASLTVTSTYNNGTTDVSCLVDTATNGTSGYDWIFKCAKTLVHDFNFKNTGCSRFMASGNELTMGGGITTEGTNIQLFVGGSDSNVGSATVRANGSLTVNSGTYSSAYAAGYYGNKTYTGTSTVTVQGTAKVGTVYAGGSSSAKQAANSDVIILIDGSQGDGTPNPAFTCPAIRTQSFGAASGLGPTGSLDVTLINTSRAGLDLSTDNPAPTTLYTGGTTAFTASEANPVLNAGTLVVESGTLTTNTPLTLTGDLTVRPGATYVRTGAAALTAANLTLEDHAALTSAGDLTATGSLTLGEGATLTSAGTNTVGGNLTLAKESTYVRTAAGSQNVAGNLTVTGPDATIKIFKDGPDGVADRLTIGGSYAGTDTLKLALCDQNGSPVDVSHGNQLLAFTTKANADSSRYTLTDADGYNLYVVGGKIVVSDEDYPYPTYYKPMAGSIPDFYTFEELVGSSNTSETRYRKYVLEGTEWKVYATGADGVTIGAPLTEDDLTKEHPLPNTDYPITEYNSCFGAMFRVGGIGSYRIAVAAASNAASVPHDANTDTSSGNAQSMVNIDEKGKTNASWAVLKQTNTACTVRKAYLVMTTTLANSSPTAISRANAETLLNSPMRLIAPNGKEMLSNGYLPAGNVVGVATGATVETEANVPTLLYHGSTEGGSHQLGEAMTVTDVTDFVKANGYGKYYGADIPAFNNDPDAAIAWRLIVIEEDFSIKNLRKVGIQMGPITNRESSAAQPTEIELTLDNFTTPDTGTNFEGQLLMIGSDNLFNSNGILGSNLHNSFSPNPEGTEDKDPSGVDKHPRVDIPIGSNDPNTEGVDRPIDTDGTTDYWSQGFIDHNGTRLSADQVQPIRKNGSMGLDLSLLEVSNTENTNWANDGAGGGGHNLYLVPQSPAVALSSTRDSTGIGYIDVLGLSTEIAIPVYKTSITHADATKPDTTEGLDVVAGHTVVVNATAENITPPSGSHVLGTFNTKVVVTVDPKLTVLDTKNIYATFHDYKRKNEGTADVWETHTMHGTYNPADHTITFDFGSDFDYTKEGETSPTYGTDVTDDDLKFFNSRADWIELQFKANTETTPTIDDAEVEYNNSIGVFGRVLYQYDRFDDTPDTRYAYAEDDFDTYLHDVTFTKLAKGNLADTDKDFAFTVTLLGEDGNLVPNKELMVVRDKLGSVPSAEVPNLPNGTLTTDANGQVTFALKHGQTITLQNMPLGSVKVAETGADDYTLSYEVTKKDSEGNVTTDVAQTTLTDHTTGDTPVSIATAQDYTFNFTNTKESTVPTGVRSKVLPFVLLALALLAGLALTTTQVVTDTIRHKRE